MKKIQVIKSLMFVGLICVVSVHSSLALAEEQSDSLMIAETSNLKLLDETIPTAIEILSEKITLEIDESLTLATKDSVDSDIETVTWTTSDEMIATVSDSGVVTGKNAGSVSITATTSGKKTASIALTVTEKEVAVTGTFGTVPWIWEDETQTLTFGEGSFPETNYLTNIYAKIENSTLLKGKKINQIVFTKPVIANKKSSSLFSNLKALKSIDNLEFLKTSNVIFMDGMFSGASKLTALDISMWDTSNVTSISSLFNSASGLTSIDVSKWNTSNMTDMSKTFFYTSGLKTLDISGWDTSSVSDMSSMFQEAYSLTTLDVSFWDTSSVSDMSSMFQGVKNLTTLNVSSWDTSKVTNMSNMFSDTKVLTTLDVSSWNINNVTTMSGMFFGATNLEKLDMSTWNTSKLESTSHMFYDVNSITELDVSSWETSNITNMSFMFYNTNKLTALDVSMWNTSKVYNMESMFKLSKNLDTLDVSKWNTSNVLNMAGMFASTSNLSSLNISSWDTSKVTNMAGMFSSATSLKSLNLSNWNTRNVTNMSQMFYDAISLETLILGENSLVKNSYLLEKQNELYTGKWISDSPDMQNSYPNSKILMETYDGSKPGKYIREKREDIVKVTGIELTPPTIELAISEETTLHPKVLPTTASNKKVSYATSDDTIATVSSTGVVQGIKEGSAIITATTEEGSFQATSTITVKGQSAFLIDQFYLGIDSYVTGSIDASILAKKVQLIVNDEVINTSALFSDGSFELETEGTITKITDKVEVIALDRKNQELERTTVTIEEQSYTLTVDPYTLYEDSTITGQTDYFHTHVALVINGEEIERKILPITKHFSFDTEGLIDYADDEVAIVGYRYDEEITRNVVVIQEPKIDMSLTPYKVNDPYLTGKVTGKSATTVRLYVNRRRQQTVKIAEDGTFNLLGVAILSPTDKVEIAVLNDAGIEIQRFSVEISK